MLLDPYLCLLYLQLSFLATWGLVFLSQPEGISQVSAADLGLVIPFCAQLAYYETLLQSVYPHRNTLQYYLSYGGGIVLCGFAALVLVFLPSGRPFLYRPIDA